MTVTTTVRLGPGGRRAVGNHTVYIRRLWSDAWVAYADAHCLECVWTSAPSMPAATVVWKYGVIKQFSSTTFTNEAKLDISRWYIKIVWQTDISNILASITTREWYGVITDVEDETAGHVLVNGVKYPTGQQILHCLGMEQLLNQSSVAYSYAVTNAAGVLEVPAPLTFNDRGKPNRSINTEGVLGRSSFLFDGQPEAPPTLVSKYWSTRDIIWYILTRLSPSRSSAWHDESIPWYLDYDWLIDNVDRPVLHQEGRTALGLLHSLLDRRRLMSFYTSVDTGNTVRLFPFSFAGADIDPGVPDKFGVKGQTYQYDLIYDADEMTAASVRTIDLGRVDRLIVRGARRTSTATWHVVADEFETMWTTSHEAAYEAAASAETGYAGWDDLKKATRNAEVRAHEALSNVYSWFGIPDDWNGKIHAAESDTLTAPAFVEEDGTTQSTLYIKDIYFDNNVRLWEGVDYSGTAIATGVAEPNEYIYRKPLIIFQRPTDNRFINGAKVGETAEGECDPTVTGSNSRWSATARAQPYSRTLEVNVSGEPQHVLAVTDFTPLAADRDVGDYDYKSRKMLITATLIDNRYAEAIYPERGMGDTTFIDAQRGFVIWAGEEYRRDYVVPGTVVDVDDDGTLTYSTSGGFVVDDTDSLKAMARIAYEWYKVSRAILVLSTNRLVSWTELNIGHFIAHVGDNTIPNNTHYREINAPITELRIRNPLIPEGGMAEPSMSIITGAAELDPLTLIPPPRRMRRRR